MDTWASAHWNPTYPTMLLERCLLGFDVKHSSKFRLMR